MLAPFDAGLGVDAEFGARFEVFPGERGDALLEGVQVDEGLNGGDAFRVGSYIDYVEEEVGLLGWWISRIGGE